MPFFLNQYLLGIKDDKYSWCWNVVCSRLSQSSNIDAICVSSHSCQLGSWPELLAQLNHHLKHPSKFHPLKFAFSSTNMPPTCVKIQFSHTWVKMHCNFAHGIPIFFHPLSGGQKGGWKKVGENWWVKMRGRKWEGGNRRVKMNGWIWGGWFVW